MNRHLRLRHNGLTLVELLVAMVVSMLLVIGLTRYFKFVGDTVANGRAALEMANQLYSAAQRVEDDVKGITSLARPGSDQAAAAGYLEIVEGPFHDYTGTTLPPPATDSVLGDVDDVIAMVTQSDKAPFGGQLLYRSKALDPATGKMVYSLSGNGAFQYEALRARHAEVVYWLTLDDKNGNGNRDYGENYVLRRRALLVMPQIALDATYGALNSAQFFNIADLSCHFTNVGGTPRWITNDVEDLTRRENRFAHVPGGAAFPNPMLAPANIPRHSDIDLTGAGIPLVFTARQGQDIILSQVVAFDVRVYDPVAPVALSRPGGNDAVTPSDPGYQNRGAVIGAGAYIDLFANRNLTAPISSVFSGQPHLRSRLGAAAVFDTWSTSYERDGLDQDNDGVADEGTDGLDNNSNGAVDDASEQETVAPYPSALRGIQIILRTIEPDTRQVQQVTISADFTPE